MTKNVPGSMASSTNDMRLHQTLARGGALPEGNFGVQGFASLTRGGGEPDQGSKYLNDKRRGAGRPVRHTRGKHPAQAAPDHGPAY